jgi:hypothetical protein
MSRYLTTRQISLTAQTVIPLFYGYCLTFIFQWIHRKDSLILISSETCLWPIQFILQLTNIENFYFAILYLGALILFATCLFWEDRFLRTLSFFVIFLIIAAFNSFGKINHGYHPYIYISFVFSLLPSLTNKKDFFLKQYKLASIFIMTQGFFLYSYTLSGFWKICGGARDFILRDISFLSSDGFAVMVANRILQTNEKPILADWIINNQWLGPMLLSCGILIEISSLFIILKYRFISIFSGFLIMLHLGNALIMNISFSSFILPIIILLSTQKQICYAPLIFLKKNRLWRYRSTYYARLFLFIILSYTFIVFTITPTRFSPEIYPIFNWSLFSTIPPRIKSDYTCHVKNPETNVFLPITDIDDTISNNIVTYHLIQKAGKAIKSKSPDSDKLLGQLEKQHLKWSNEYYISERKFDVLNRYKHGEIIEEAKLIHKIIKNTQQ